MPLDANQAKTLSLLKNVHLITDYLFPTKFQTTWNIDVENNHISSLKFYRIPLSLHSVEVINLEAFPFLEHIGFFGCGLTEFPEDLLVFDSLPNRDRLSISINKNPISLLPVEFSVSEKYRQLWNRGVSETGDPFGFSADNVPFVSLSGFPARYEFSYRHISLNYLTWNGYFRASIPDLIANIDTAGTPTQEIPLPFYGSLFELPPELAPRMALGLTQSIFTVSQYFPIDAFYLEPERRRPEDRAQSMESSPQTHLSAFNPPASYPPSSDPPSSFLPPHLYYNSHIVRNPIFVQAFSNFLTHIADFSENSYFVYYHKHPMDLVRQYLKQGSTLSTSASPSFSSASFLSNLLDSTRIASLHSRSSYQWDPRAPKPPFVSYITAFQMLFPNQPIHAHPVKDEDVISLPSEPLTSDEVLRILHESDTKVYRYFQHSGSENDWLLQLLTLRFSWQKDEVSIL